MIKILHHVLIDTYNTQVDGHPVSGMGTGTEQIENLIQKYLPEYDNIYKMSRLSQLGVLAVELLNDAGSLAQCGEENHDQTEKTGVCLFSSSSCITADIAYYETIQEEFFPVPGLFVYTAPNVVAGDISIKNNYSGDTCFYILPGEDNEMMKMIIEVVYNGFEGNVIAGWLDHYSDDNYKANIYKLNFKK